MSREDLPVFRLVDLRKIYGQGDAAVHALRGVDLSIAAGELLVLLGPSGSGKSTLLNVLGGLDRPTSGDIILDGQPTGGWSSLQWTRARRDLVGIVFQAFHLLPAMTAERVSKWDWV